MTLKSDRPPFDEAAAEEQLARIRDAIEATRRKRQQAVLDFEAFLRGVRASARAQPAGGSDSGEAAPGSALQQRVIPSGPAAAPDANLAALTGSAAGQQPAFRTTPGIPAKGASLFGDEPPRAVVSPPQRSKKVGRSAAVVGAVLLVSAVALVQLRVDPESTQADVPPAPPREAIKPVATTSAQGDPDRDGVAVLSSPPAGALQVEFVTIRAVWMRISVDGERVVERQVPAGQRLRFEAARQVVVRAGDAGGVRLSVGGGPERPLGRDGQVVNRTIAR